MTYYERPHLLPMHSAEWECQPIGSTIRIGNENHLHRGSPLHGVVCLRGLLFAHSAARYFSVDRITKDQVESYATRTGQTVAEVERWLGPNLGY